MCGIVGYLGQRRALPVLLEGLRELEYRGYDSAGMATVHNRKLERRRACGDLKHLERLLSVDPLQGTVGIAHTRWASQGISTYNNAHPHIFGHVAVVHNGTITNHAALRRSLAMQGIKPETNTDTELAAMLCDLHLRQGAQPLDAVRAAVSACEGENAFVFLIHGQDDLVIAAQKGSPLALGWGGDELVLSSDVLALASVTSEVSYLQEGDFALLTPRGARIYNQDLTPVARHRRQIQFGQVAPRHKRAWESSLPAHLQACLVSSFAPGRAVGGPRFCQ